MKPTPEHKRALRRIDTLDTLTDAEVDTLLLCARERRLRVGEGLYEEGRPGDTMALLLRGELGVRRLGPHGTVVDLRRVRVGELVGELACVDPAPRAATVLALADSLLVEIDRSAHEQLVDNAPRVGSHLLGMIIRATGQRLRLIDEQISLTLGDAMPPAVELPTRATAPRAARPAGTASAGATEPATPTLWKKLADRLWGSA